MAESNSAKAVRRHESWREVLTRWKASGLSQAAFCRRHRIAPWKLAWWKKRLAGHIVAPAASFVPIQIVMPTTPSGATSSTGSWMELILRGERRLRFSAQTDPAKLAAIAAALEALPVPEGRLAVTLRRPADHAEPAVGDSHFPVHRTHRHAARL